MWIEKLNNPEKTREKEHISLSERAGDLEFLSNWVTIASAFQALLP